jgi:hypothetical protein
MAKKITTEVSVEDVISDIVGEDVMSDEAIVEDGKTEKATASESAYEVLTSALSHPLVVSHWAFGTHKVNLEEIIRNFR